MQTFFSHLCDKGLIVCGHIQSTALSHRLLYAALINPECQGPCLHLTVRETHLLVAFATHTDFSDELSCVALSPRQPVYRDPHRHAAACKCPSLFQLTWRWDFLRNYRLVSQAAISGNTHKVQLQILPKKNPFSLANTSVDTSLNIRKIGDPFTGEHFSFPQPH